jgi:predicted DNA-binding transcriptional regulator AlpA
VSRRLNLSPEVERVVAELSHRSDDPVFAEAFRKAWVEALAQELARAAIVPIERKPALSLEEAALLTGYSVSTLSRLVARGVLAEIPHVPGRTMVARVELDRWIQSGTAKVVAIDTGKRRR